jgi:2-polyprenyl-3-methyl-5-hydroxy-6-metoxy-1,4-benzoquinol methylase
VTDSNTTGFNDPLFVHFYEETDNTRLTDVSFYVEQAKTAAGVVLEAGCGSGRLLIPMLEAGVDIEGFDGSPLMLKELTNKLSRHGLSANVWTARMQDVELEPAKYALIICAFNTFLHNLSHEEQLGTLRCFREALRNTGRLILDITNPFNFDLFSTKAFAKTFEASIFDPKTDSETTIWRWFDRNMIQQLGTYHREYETTTSAGKTIRTTGVHFRWTYPEEMRLLLEVAGFHDIDVRGDFHGKPLDEDSEMQVWTATV